MIIISNFTVSIIINRFIFFKHRNFKSHNFHAKDNIKQDTVDFVAKFIGKKKKKKEKYSIKYHTRWNVTTMLHLREPIEKEREPNPSNGLINDVVHRSSSTWCKTDLQG